MSYTSPSLADILANEQLMNTRLTKLTTLLRTILDDLDIQYTSSNTVIELIRLLEKHITHKLMRMQQQARFHQYLVNMCLSEM